jgi:hypothetical protein
MTKLDDLNSNLTDELEDFLDLEELTKAVNKLEDLITDAIADSEAAADEEDEDSDEEEG